MGSGDGDGIGLVEFIPGHESCSESQLPVACFGQRINFVPDVSLPWNRYVNNFDGIVDIQTVPREQRLGYVATRGFMIYENFLRLHECYHKCKRCWMRFDHCLCRHIAKIQRSCLSQHSLILNIHYRELGSASNSGKLLLNIADTFVASYPPHEREMLRRFNDRTVVLWPGEGSQSLEAYIASNSERHKFAWETGLQIVILDGTWNAARHLNRTIPKWVPRIRLSDSHRSEFGGARRSTNKPRVCTAGALVSLLRELGLDDGRLDDLKNSVHELFDECSVQNQRPRLRE